MINVLINNRKVNNVVNVDVDPVENQFKPSGYNVILTLEDNSSFSFYANRVDLTSDFYLNITAVDTRCTYRINWLTIRDYVKKKFPDAEFVCPEVIESTSSDSKIALITAIKVFYENGNAEMFSTKDLGLGACATLIKNSDKNDTVIFEGCLEGNEQK